nr:hypothetical protein [uncultured Pseudomonas sp.]
MQDYKFKLIPFQNMDWSEEEKEARLRACLEDAKNGFDAATVTLDDDVLSISVGSKDELSAEECRERFKSILVNGSLFLFAEQLI